jgi:catechol 2,3-dioxygenase-like lactoylglutathione lyase family enzyme
MVAPGTSKYRLAAIVTRRYSRIMTPAVRLFRIIMPVANIDEGAKFYSALLGSPGFRISGGRHYFQCGDVILAVYDATADGDAGGIRSNPQHVYFAVPDLPAVFARAQQLGGLSTEIGDGRLPMGEIARRPWGELSFYIDDPWGNPLCFVDESSIFKGPS